MLDLAIKDDKDLDESELHELAKWYESMAGDVPAGQQTRVAGHGR